MIGVKDVGLAQTVLQRRSGNDRIVHRSKVTCDALCGRAVWFRSVSRRLLRECAPGERADAADALADIGVERGAHMRQATGLVNVSTPVQACRFCGLVSRLATIRGPYGIGRQPRRGDLGASVLVRAGCGEGECGGSRLVGSEKSPIVTLRWCVGLGGLIENVLTRTAFTELVGGTSVVCRKSQSSPGIAVRAAGVHRSGAVGTVRHPVAGRWLALCSHGNAVSQVTVDSGNGPQPAKVEPVRLKVACSQVDRA